MDLRAWQQRAWKPVRSPTPYLARPSNEPDDASVHCQIGCCRSHERSLSIEGDERVPARQLHLGCYPDASACGAGPYRNRTLSLTLGKLWGRYRVTFKVMRNPNAAGDAVALVLGDGVQQAPSGQRPREGN